MKIIIKIVTELKRMTDGKAIDSSNHVQIIEAIMMTKDTARGSWLLVQAYDMIVNFEKEREK